jgi:phosphate transport system substrate-binding protein
MDEKPPITVLNIKGADSMVQPVTVWASKYMAAPSNIKVNANGGGSGTGIASLLNGKVEIATSVRKLNAAEAAQFIATYGKEPKRTLIGYDAMAVCVHKDNPISSISLDDLKEIFSKNGRIKDWQELGSRDSEAIVSCGVLTVVNQIFDDAVFGKGSQSAEYYLGFFGTAALVEGCAAKRGAIGYAPLGYMITRVSG